MPLVVVFDVLLVEFIGLLLIEFEFELLIEFEVELLIEFEVELLIEFEVEFIVEFEAGVVELTDVILLERLAFAFDDALLVVLFAAGPPQAAIETANAATAEIVKTFFIIFLNLL